MYVKAEEESILSYGDDDNADRQNLCQHYWIFCNGGEYNAAAGSHMDFFGDTRTGISILLDLSNRSIIRKEELSSGGRGAPDIFENLRS